MTVTVFFSSSTESTSSAILRYSGAMNVCLLASYVALIFASSGSGTVTALSASIVKCSAIRVSPRQLLMSVDHAVGDGDAVDQRRGELLAQLIAPAQLQEAALADAKPVEDVLEGEAVELAVRPLEGLIVLHRLGERIVRQRQAELVGVRLDRRPGDELREDAVVEARRRAPARW